MARKRILIIDDDNSDREAIRRALKNAPYTVKVAKGGREGLLILRRQPVDLVLIDMFMPEMSGRETCERIRADEKIKNVTIIFVTVAAFSKAGKLELEKLGIADYITKPFDAVDLLKRIKNVLTER